MPTPASSTSSRSIRASRSSTRSPSRSPASTSSRRRSTSSTALRSARRSPACPRRTTSGSTATRCSAASPPRIPSTTSSPTTAASPPIAAPPASASGSTAAPPIPARSSPASTIRCWRRSPPGRRRRGEAIARMDRALREFRIRGVATNLTFLEAIINHPNFRDNTYTTRFIDTTPELFAQVKRQDRATKLLTYLADVTVNGHPETRGRPLPKADAAAPHRALSSTARSPPAPSSASTSSARRNSPTGCASEKRVLVTDTTMRDGHQSLLATRMRTHDIAAHRRRLCARAAAAPVARMLGRRDLRRRHALPHRGPVGAPGAGPRGARRTSCCRCCCAAPTASATPTIPTMSCSISSARRPPAASTSSASSTA